MINFLNGIATAMITPFDENGVNFDSLGGMIKFQIARGVAALVILGTTGEPSTMTEDEKTAVIKYSVEKAAGRVKIIVGTGSNDTKKAIAASKRAEELGADGVLAVTPYYNKCTQNGLYQYYKDICDAVSIPVIAYNVPSRTGVNILPETAEKLAGIPNIAGIKDACGNMAQTCETMRLIRGKCDLYSGEDGLNLPILAIGGAGVISVISNVIPEQVNELYTLVKNGDLDKANELQDSLLPFINACFIEVNPIPVKTALNILGFNVGNTRPPLTELEEKHEQILFNELKKVVHIR